MEREAWYINKTTGLLKEQESGLPPRARGRSGEAHGKGRIHPASKLALLTQLENKTVLHTESDSSVVCFQIEELYNVILLHKK